MSQRIFIATLLLAASLVAPSMRGVDAMAQSVKSARAESQDMPSEPERSMFTQGEMLYKQGRYVQAAIVLQNLLRNYPKSSIADISLLWLGRSYIQLGNFAEAERVARALHAMKESPFTEIYDGELRNARRRAPSREIAQNNSGVEKTRARAATVTPKPSPPPTQTPTLAPKTTPPQKSSDTPKPTANAKPIPTLIIKPTPTPKTTLPQTSTVAPIATTPRNTKPREAVAAKTKVVTPPNSIAPPKKTSESKSNSKPNPPVAKTSNKQRAPIATVPSAALTPPLVPHLRIEQLNETTTSGPEFYYRLVLTNDGTGMAKDIIVNDRLPDNLQFISSEPRLKLESTAIGAQRFIWRVAKLAPNTTVVLHIKVRLKPGLSNERVLSYKDAKGKNYP